MNLSSLYSTTGHLFSDTPPVGPTPGQEWVDTSTMLRYEYYNSQWVQSPSSTGPQGINTVFSDTAPTSPTAGMRWVNTTIMVEFEYYGSAWVEVAGSSQNNMADGVRGDLTLSGGGATWSITKPGTVLQTVYAEYSANVDVAGAIPWDDTIPQITEGTQIFSQSITPSSTANKILISVNGFVSGGNNQTLLSIFAGVSADAIYATANLWANVIQGFSAQYIHSPATILPVTYSVRIGPDGAATIRLNGTTIGRKFGGVSKTTLIMQEIKG